MKSASISSNTLNAPARRHMLTACVAALLIASTALHAGPLTPPAGPIVSTGKTLTEVEPRIAINSTNTPGDADSSFKITQRGSYYLTGNITGVSGRHGIEISTSGVTLDLNGFDLVGVAGSLDGVNVTAFNLRNISVINGSVRSWGGDGVDLNTSTGVSGRVENIVANGNTGRGIVVGSTYIVANCTANQNGGTGILTNDGCTVRDCTARQNTGNGIEVSNGSTVSRCSAIENTVNGIDLFLGCSLTDSTALDNTGIGIDMQGGGTIHNCVARGNNIGINTGFDTTIVSSGAVGNTSHGFSVGIGNSLLNCTASFNQGNGINAPQGNVKVSECTSRGNTLNGFSCTAVCTVLGSKFDTNGNQGDGAGILVTGVDSRIEGNTCTGNDRGIDVDGSGNIIIKNTCSGNATNWDVVAGNVILVINAATTAAAVTGNSGGVAPGSTDPNANFTY